MRTTVPGVYAAGDCAITHHRQLGATWLPPATTAATPDDHKAYYPGATTITTRITGDTHTGRLLGAQLVGDRGAEIAKRIDIYAAALFHDMTVDAVSDLDLSYTPPLGSPWDAVQVATQTWTATHRTAPTRPPDPDRASPPPAATTGSAEPVADAGPPLN